MRKTVIPLIAAAISILLYVGRQTIWQTLQMWQYMTNLEYQLNLLFFIITFMFLTLVFTLFKNESDTFMVVES